MCPKATDCGDRYTLGAEKTSHQRPFLAHQPPRNDFGPQARCETLRTSPTDPNSPDCSPVLRAARVTMLASRLFAGTRPMQPHRPLTRRLLLEPLEARRLLAPVNVPVNTDSPGEGSYYAQIQNEPALA